jgi:hypothetical protein
VPQRGQPECLEKSIDQIAVTHKFKGEKPKASDVFGSSFLPPLAERKAW